MVLPWVFLILGVLAVLAAAVTVVALLLDTRSSGEASPVR